MKAAVPRADNHRIPETIPLEQADNKLGEEHSAYKFGILEKEIHKLIDKNVRNMHNMQHSDQTVGSASLRLDSKMPRTMDGRFFGLKYTGIHIDDEVTESMKDSFTKLLPENAVGQNNGILKPDYLRDLYLKLGLDKSAPSLYSMALWMCEINT